MSESAGNPPSEAENNPHTLPLSSPFIPLLSQRTRRYMKKAYLFSVLDLVRDEATDTLLHCLEHAREIQQKCHNCEYKDDARSLSEYEQKPLDIKVIE